MTPKKEIQFWIFAFLIGLGAIILTFDSAGAKISQYVPQVKRILNSGIYAQLSGLRASEADFWASVKGIQINNDENDEDTTAQNPTNATPTPTLAPDVTPTVEPTMADYSNSIVKTPFTVQLIGDSMVLEGFGPMMKNKLLEYKDISVKINGKYSTGLNRVDYYDWYKESSTIIKNNKPDVLILQFGSNDGQNIIAKDGSIGNLGSEKWKTIYTERVADYLALVSPKVGLIYWVGHPIPRPQDFYNKFSTMNPIYKAECAKYTNCRFVEEWDRFAVNGAYVAAVADDNGLVQTVKGGDGVHVTNHGGNIMADEVIKMMDKDIEMEKK